MPNDPIVERPLRDENDIGRILSSLFNVAATEPVKLFEQYLVRTDSGIRFRPDHQKSVIAIGSSNFRVQDLFPFTIEHGFRVIPGGSAIVFEVGNPQIGTLRYALKVERPSVRDELSEKERDERQEDAEFVKHAPLSHENIARVYAAGQFLIDVASGDLRRHIAIFMEWIDDAVPLNAYIMKSQPAEAVELITQCFDALSYLHDSGLIHWDLKSDNLLVDGKKRTVKLMDVGNARRLDSYKTGDFALSTRGNLPPELADRLEEVLQGTPRSSSTDSRRAKIPLTEGFWDSPWLDLWMLARELYELFSPDPVDNAKAQPYGTPGQWSADRRKFLDQWFKDDDRDAQFALRFIRLTLVRLLRPISPTAERYYGAASAVAADLRKLAPEFGAAQNVHELWAVPQRVMRTPVSGNVPYTPRLAKLFNSVPVQRLTRHLQLGSIAHAYPGATHQRFQHAAGVLSVTCQYVRALYSDQTNPFWRASIEQQDIEALLVAAAVHDMGHIACGHYLEEMSGLFRGRTHEDYAVSVLRGEEVEGVRFGKVNTKAIETDREILIRIIREHWQIEKSKVPAFLNRVANILRPSRRTNYAEQAASQFVLERSEWIKVEILHSILDSAIDADKLDYLMRDAYHCGVEYANGIDTDRFFQALTAFSDLSSLGSTGANSSSDPQTESAEPAQEARHACVGVTDKGILSVESILIARYQMFRSIYWHHTARAETAMLQFIVAEFAGSWSGQSIGFSSRLEQLIHTFRNATDNEAFTWLKERLPRPGEEPDGTELGRYDYQLFHDICDCLLGDRERLYHQIFELRYESNGFGSRSSTTPQRAIYEMLEESSRQLNRDPGMLPERFTEKIRKLRGTIARFIALRLGDRVEFNLGDVLIDIPPAGRDQVNNVFVYRDGTIRPIQNVSPLADAVREAFRYWSRYVRIFISRRALERCRPGITDRELEKACWESLRRLQMVEDEQRYLFGDEDLLNLT